MTLTLEEQERRWYMIGCPALADAFHAADIAPTERDLEKSYEAPMEQSEFRRQLLEDIEVLCKQAKHSRFKETKELASAILEALDDSYVEL